MTKPSAKSTGKRPLVLIPQPHGGAIAPGAGGGPQPGSGRPPDAFKALCRQLASGEITVEQVEAILKDKGHPQFMAALKWATEHGYGKPTEHVEHSGTVTHKHQVWKFGKNEVAF